MVKGLMKQRFAIVLLPIIALVVLSGIAYAAELKPSNGSINALNTGYAITRWPLSSGDVLPGDSATVRACTTDPPYPDATAVVFRWHAPDGTSYDVGPETLTPMGDTWDGNDIYYAED